MREMQDGQRGREASLRWGGIIGGAGAALGVLSYLAGTILAPVNSTHLSGDAAIVGVFVHVLLVLVILGLVLGLCYYAGMRIARDQLDATPTSGTETPTVDRAPAALGGAVAMLLYWFITTLYVYLFPPFGQRDGSLQALEGHVVLGVIFVIMGAGLGSMGARGAAARRLITRVIVAPAPRPATIVPIVSAAVAPTEAAPMAQEEVGTTPEHE